MLYLPLTNLEHMVLLSLVTIIQVTTSNHSLINEEGSEDKEFMRAALDNERSCPRISVGSKEVPGD
jgi:hypothetical protein